MGLANFFEGEVFEIKDTYILIKHGERLFKVAKNDYKVNIGEKVTLLVRPECITLSPIDQTSPEDCNELTGEIKNCSFLGKTARYTVNTGDISLTVDDLSVVMHGFMSGRVKALIDKNRIHILPKQGE